MLSFLSLAVSQSHLAAHKLTAHYSDRVIAQHNKLGQSITQPLFTENSPLFCCERAFQDSSPPLHSSPISAFIGFAYPANGIY